MNAAVRTLALCAAAVMTLQGSAVAEPATTQDSRADALTDGADGPPTTATETATTTATTAATATATATETATAQPALPLRPVRVVGDVAGELGDPLEGCEVRAGDVAVLTDSSGKFALEFPAAPDGWVMITATKQGYQLAVLNERLLEGETRHVHLKLGQQPAYDVKVTATRLLPAPPKVDHTPAVSRFNVTRGDIDRTPGALEDVSRVVAALPGVVADPDLMATFFVRGGGPDEVVYYLDRVPLSNPFHLGGFASIYNPLLIESADFAAGGTPAQYEPALSGVLDVRYASGETTRPRVVADISANTAKAVVQTPTGIPGLSALVSLRRSYFELYFSALSGMHIVGANSVAPEIGDYMARLHYRRGRHELSATYLLTTDGLDFLLKPGEQVMVNFVGSLKLSNTLHMGLLQDRVDLGARRELTVTAAVTGDQNAFAVASQKTYARDVDRREVLGRADLTIPFSDRNRLTLGLQYARRSLDFRGQVSDTRANAPWADRPMIYAGEPILDVNPSMLMQELAAYAEHTVRFAKRFGLEGGARLQVDPVSLRPVYSLRAAASAELPVGTMIKLSTGMATQPTTDPLVIDPTYGNPSIGAPRVRQLVFGVEQPLPIQALLRVEAFGKWMDRLTVNPDTPTGLQAVLGRHEPAYQALGTGFARGVDLMLIGRARRFAYGLSGGLVWSDRTNPLAAERKSYPAPWDQRWTMAANVSWSPAEDWLLTARFSFHTGRPYTPVTGFFVDDANRRWLPVFGPTNSARYSDFEELSLRVQRRFTLFSVPQTFYFELLNATNAQNIFTYAYDTGDYATATAPAGGAFNHLPIRPFLGVRGEY